MSCLEQSPKQSPEQSLEQRVYSVLNTGDELTANELNKLLQDLADSCETTALVRVWDMRGSKLISEITWQSMDKLHNLGKGNIPIGTIIPPVDRRRLAAPRRLHKICKHHMK